MLQADGLAMRFSGQRYPLFGIPSLALPPGGSLGIRGPSGAGKTTLFNCLAGIERPTSGRILWNGLDICTLPEWERDRWRHVSLGLVFQEFHLIDGLSALDNV
jgi:putative ABC transport system ATP-binding protein